MLHFAGEILPAKLERKSATEKIYFSNILACYPCLDEKKSVIRHSFSGSVIEEVTKHVFLEERIRDSIIFKIPETISTSIYTIERRDGPSLPRLFRENKFLGISFEEVWSE
jgi:hypothetical protein